MELQSGVVDLLLQLRHSRIRQSQSGVASATYAMIRQVPSCKCCTPKASRSSPRQFMAVQSDKGTLLPGARTRQWPAQVVRRGLT